VSSGDIHVPASGSQPDHINFCYKLMPDGTYALVASTGAEISRVGALLFATPAEFYGHLGHAYFTGYSSPFGANIANNASIEVLIKSGGFRCHGVANWFGNGDLQLFFYEGTTVSSDGTPLPVVNRDRESSNTSGCEFYVNPTVSDDGNLIGQRWVLAGGTPGLAQAGVADFDREWVLAKNTNYLMRLQNRSGGSVRMGMTLPFYEENNGW
jgi:hypothetical protein